MTSTLKRYLRESYLAGCSTWVRQRLGKHTGPRSFERVAIVAAFGKKNGITRGAELQWRALRDFGVRVDMVDATPALRNPFYRAAHQPASAYIFHSGGPQTASLVGAVLPHARNAWRIGYWAWELPDPPPDWIGCDAILDEIWAPSDFAKASLGKAMRRPIAVVPHRLPATARREAEQRGEFTVLAMADSRSSFARKNPEGAVRAFQAAFGQDAKARLLLKLSASDTDMETLDQRLGGALSAPNVQVIREFLSEAALDALYARADVLLSLHRAEGFGLPMLEALSRGIPVVATGWSGNMDFTTPDNSFLVPYRLTPVADTDAVYHGSQWAEPDLAAAAQALQRLAADAALRARLGAAGHDAVSAQSFVLPDLAAAARAAA
ncbi:glycosyltransferase [Acidisoma sp. 7E03]